MSKAVGMEKKLNVGIIGLGRIGKVHAENIRSRLPNVHIRAVADVRPGIARQLAEQYGVDSAYERYGQLLDDGGIDAVIICSPTDTHAQMIIEAAQAGKHIFCEKPIDLSIEKAVTVMSAVESAGVKMQLGFNRRFDHNFAKAREIIASGAIGKLHILKITSRDPAPPHADYIAASGGMFLDMSIHDFDMARFLTHSEPEEIYVAASCLVDPVIGEAGDVDTALITVKFETGEFCVIDNSRRAAYGYDQRVEVFGSKGKVETANDTPSTVVLSTEDGVFGEKPLYFFLERYAESFAEEIRLFAEAVTSGSDVPVGASDGIKAIRMAIAAKMSLAENRPVRMAEVDGIGL
jgi:myo-inositol 2-dehydrogenase/D-chiro-inositol 1-dehydrogenase